VSEAPAIDAALEADYALRARHPERDAEYARMREAGLGLRARHAAMLDLRYGEGPRMRLDYLGAGRGAPLLVFFHGGYWRALEKEIFTFLAGPLLARGISVALPGYDLAPAVTVPQIVAQAHAALGWLAQAGLGFDPGRAVLSGHSAGAHLAAMAMLDPRTPLGLRGLLGVSGIYDLEPLLRTSVGASVALTATQACTASPLRALGAGAACPARLVVGAGETPGFISQTLRFAEALRARGDEAEAVLVPGTTHFSVLHELFDAPTLGVVQRWLR
jgi:arylformamidase